MNSFITPCNCFNKTSFRYEHNGSLHKANQQFVALQTGQIYVTVIQLQSINQAKLYFLLSLFDQITIKTWTCIHFKL